MMFSICGLRMEVGRSVWRKREETGRNGGFGNPEDLPDLCRKRFGAGGRVAWRTSGEISLLKNRMMKCHPCRTENDDRNRYCRNCGAQLSDGEEPKAEKRWNVPLLFVGLIGVVIGFYGLYDANGGRIPLILTGIVTVGILVARMIGRGRRG